MTENSWTEYREDEDDREMRIPGVEVAQAASEAGFTGEDLVTAVAVSKRESDWRPRVIGILNPKSPDYGLWQISGLWHSELLDRYDWTDPRENAEMARHLFLEAERMYGEGNGFTPWHVYTRGTYTKSLEEAREAVEEYLALEDPSEDVPAEPTLLDRVADWLKELFSRFG